MKKFSLVAVIATVAATAAVVAIPATATAHLPHHRRHVWRLHHRCRLHDVAYRAGGTLTSWGLTQNANGTWSGTLTVDVLHGNRHAGGQVGTDTTYTITDATVRFGPHATNPPAADSRIQLRGRALALGKRCTGTGTSTTETYAIRHIRVHAPAATPVS